MNFGHNSTSPSSRIFRQDGADVTGRSKFVNFDCRPVAARVNFPASGINQRSGTTDCSHRRQRLDRHRPWGQVGGGVYLEGEGSSWPRRDMMLISVLIPGETNDTGERRGVSRVPISRVT